MSTELQEYTRITNEVLQALAQANLNGTEYSVILTVIRKTWGFHKTEDSISISQFVKETGRAKSGVICAIKTLVQKNVLVQKTGQIRKLDSKGKEITIYGVNKYSSTWVVQNTGIVQKTGQMFQAEVVQNTGHTKERKEKSVYSDLNSINEELLKTIASDYKVALVDVEFTFEQLKNYEGIDKYKDLNKALRRWILKGIQEKRIKQELSWEEQILEEVPDARII